ncbi:MAG: hypothetical protein GEU91_16050 [Rhizobiales bacterium]|nr:hypothetical protein [Hyphomicrobiales bacterium]
MTKPKTDKSGRIIDSPPKSAAGTDIERRWRDKGHDRYGRALPGRRWDTVAPDDDPLRQWGET